MPRREVAGAALAAVAAVTGIATPAGTLAPEPAPAVQRVTVAAGAHDRAAAIASFPLPPPGLNAAWVLTDVTGRDVPIQAGSGLAWFTVDDLKAGTEKAYTLELRKGAPPRPPEVTAVRQGDVVLVGAPKRPILRYQGGPGALPPWDGDIKPVFRRGAYIHPVYTPDMRIVTDDYPPDHRHHHGIWTAWTRTELDGRKPDFWNMGEGTGTVVFDQWDEVWSGTVHAGARTRHRHVDLSGGDPVTALRETWEIRAYAPGPGTRPGNVFDLDVRQTSAAPAPLVLPEYHYGGLGVRGARSWNGATGVAFLTSEGKDRSNGHGTRARWCRLTGRALAGAREERSPGTGGLAILGHPGNYRAPQPMRIHPTEPFFCFAPSQLGRWQIDLDTPYTARYRFVAFDGELDAKELDRLWNDFADPPRVTVAAVERAHRPAAVRTPVAFDVAGFDRARVLAAADRYLREAPVTVTASSSPRSAGGPHDFFSEGDYWWPDPANPGGPYVQRDGLTNPDNFVAHRQALMRLSVQVPALAAAWTLTREPRYAEHAGRHLRAWFLDAATRMSPHLRYAQAIQGRVTGRGIGIIDTLHLVEVARAIEVLEASPALTPEQREGVKGWFRDYLAWMTTHPYGIEERDAKNNHGTCWLLQAAAFARLTGQPALLDEYRARFKTVLLPQQMAADGSFPLELRRTKPYGYSLFNLDAMAGVARVLATPEDDLWAFELPDGRGLGRAVAFMYPYVKDRKTWPLPPDAMYDAEWPMRHASLLFAGLALGRPEYVDLWKGLPADSTVDEVVRNFFIRQPALWLK
jgi:hypothetical protein